MPGHTGSLLRTPNGDVEHQTRRTTSGGVGRSSRPSRAGGFGKIPISSADSQESARPFYLLRFRTPRTAHAEPSSATTGCGAVFDARPFANWPADSSYGERRAAACVAATDRWGPIYGGVGFCQHHISGMRITSWLARTRPGKGGNQHRIHTRSILPSAITQRIPVCLNHNILWSSRGEISSSPTAKTIGRSVSYCTHFWWPSARRIVAKRVLKRAAKAHCRGHRDGAELAGSDRQTACIGEGAAHVVRAPGGLLPQVATARADSGGPRPTLLLLNSSSFEKRRDMETRRVLDRLLCASASPR